MSTEARVARSMEQIRKTVEPASNAPLCYVTVRSPVAYAAKQNADALGVDWSKVSPIEGRYLFDAALVRFLLNEFEAQLRRNPDLVIRENDE